jgi:hypothetical protein
MEREGGLEGYRCDSILTGDEAEDSSECATSEWGGEGGACTIEDDRMSVWIDKGVFFMTGSSSKKLETPSTLLAVVLSVLTLLVSEKEDEAIEMVSWSRSRSWRSM